MALAAPNFSLIFPPYQTLQKPWISQIQKKKPHPRNWITKQPELIGIFFFSSGLMGLQKHSDPISPEEIHYGILRDNSKNIYCFEWKERESVGKLFKGVIFFFWVFLCFVLFCGLIMCWVWLGFERVEHGCRLAVWWFKLGCTVVVGWSLKASSSIWILGLDFVCLIDRWKIRRVNFVCVIWVGKMVR